ncbi:cytochrome p450 family 4 [Holotrichia oblita]|uniref:Cytochrome p450 family 4 n=1 Tax=Holotrichia oblita TaxID=644536 RepID=A0ACB9TWC2_HOLOL|nr:cytochrome p450 family 4 [Holotrichia oblita]
MYLLIYLLHMCSLFQIHVVENKKTNNVYVKEKKNKAWNEIANGVTIPKGTEVSIAIYATHHDEKNFPNPNIFDPDRFLPENADKIQPYTFLPFTKGPRDCIELITNVRTNFQETSDKGYLNARSTYLTIFMNRAYSSLKRSELYFSHTHEYKIYKKCIDILKKFPLPIIEAAKTARKKKNIFDGENESSRKVVDFFLDSDISENEFRDNIDMFIVAGHDTPGSGIAFTLYELAQNSVVQNKLLDESISLLGKDPDAVVTLQDIQNMTYLDCVLKETLRKYPSVPSYERTLEEDITIDGITIPRGTEVAISAYAIHHDEDYFPKPDVYDPDRFLLENSDKIQPYSYIPFSKGPRDCIGKTIAMLVMKSIITKILRNFELLPANTTHTPELTCEFVLKSANGLPVKILRRSL